MVQKTPHLKKPYGTGKVLSYSEVFAWKFPSISKSCMKFLAGWGAKQSKAGWECISSFLPLSLSSRFQAQMYMEHLGAYNT